MPTKKIFKTLDEQIAILESKGLIVENKKETKDILFRENYYFITGYRFLLIKSPKDKHFIPGSTFKELYAIFNFDRALRNILFKNILIVENNIKSIISYRLSERYGVKEKEYLQHHNFTEEASKKRQVDDLIYKMNRQIRKNAGSHEATRHYMSTYGYIPFWVLVKLLSFGIVTELYRILKSEDQLTISKYYNLDIESLKTYLGLLANYRNICAHEDMAFTKRTDVSINDTIYHQYLDIPKKDSEYIYGKNDLMALIIVLKSLLTNEEFKLLLYEIHYEVNVLDSKIHSIPSTKILDAMGLPNNYYNLSKKERT